MVEVYVTFPHDPVAKASKIGVPSHDRVAHSSQYA